MTGSKIVFESPWMLALLIPALALIVLPWLKIPKEMRRGPRNTLPVILHAVIALALVLILSGAAVSTPVPEEPAEDESGAADGAEAHHRRRNGL